MTQKYNALYRESQIRQVEKLACHQLNLSESTLMQRAAEAALAVIKKRFPHINCFAVFCGGGNNGGDGYMLAYLADLAGYRVIIYHDNLIDDLPDAAKDAASKAISKNIRAHSLEDTIDSDVELIVDALLGIGLKGVVRNPLKSVIEYINDQHIPVLSIDVPSGLHADTGTVLGSAIKADVTITFIGLKNGFYTCDGPDCTGETVLNGLELSDLLNGMTPAGHLLEKNQFKQFVQPRRKNAHKGSFGHVLVIGGGRGMPGAAVLAAMAAMRVGAGSVAVAMHPQYANQPLADFPEAMIYGIDSGEDLQPLLEQVDVVILGPGLGEDNWAKTMFSKTIASQQPLVIDASALNLLAHAKQHDENWILTPHPGEAARLLNLSTKDIQADRFKASNHIQRQYGGTVVLKGVGTIVDVGATSCYLCSAGNPGMATAGMGDVLSGIIAGLVAQGLSLQQAALLGVWLHAKSGDDAVARLGQKGLLATDLMPYIRKRMNSLS